jgi:hypothetical protein
MKSISLITGKCNTQKQKILKCRKVTGFLRRVTSRLVYGRKKAKGPRPVLPIDICVENFNRKGYGEQWSVAEFEHHQQGLETLYYFGNDDPREPYILVNIDIDILKSQGLGTSEGARELAEHYKQLFPGVYFEPSTSGNSQHGYLLVEKEYYTSEVVKQGLKKLEAYLAEQAKGFDVEKVEIMGTPPQVRWAGREIDDMNYGKLAKLPRQATLDDLQNLHVIRMYDLIKTDKYKVQEATPPKGAGRNNVVNFSFWELWCSSIPHESLRVLC